MNFELGQKVVALCDYGPVKKGMIGTILCVTDNTLGVEFDKVSDGHYVSINENFKHLRACKPNSGWWMCFDQVTHYRKPLKNKVASNSYTSELRERVKRYFPKQSSRAVECFIKSVQRLNVSKAKHCV